MMCAEAIADPPPFERLRAVVLYDTLARRLVSSLKYGDRTDLGPWLAKWMFSAGQEILHEADLIVPVPLHRKRLFSRRFNQSAELGRHLGELSGIAFKPGVLLRKKNTARQVGLTQNQRERNLSGAFIVPEGRKIDLKGRRVLLIDDVYTTGATLNECSKTLLDHGAQSINTLTLSKVVRD